MRGYVRLFPATFAAGHSFGRRHANVASPDVLALSEAAIHHITLPVIDSLGDRHHLTPPVLNDEHLVVLQLPDEAIGAVARRTRAHDGDKGVSQEIDPDPVVPVHRDGTALPGPFKTHQASLYEPRCRDVDATLVCPRL